MGNRGAAQHLSSGRLQADGSDSRKRWITCTLDDTPGSSATTGTSKYAKLFFLDEAVGLAAGHRPCKLCRPDAYGEFVKRWKSVLGPIESIDDVDRALRSERTSPERSRDRATALPDGVFVLHDGEPHVLSDGRAHRWTATGYDGAVAASDLGTVEVLTPPSTVAVIAAGYEVSVGV